MDRFGRPDGRADPRMLEQLVAAAASGGASAHQTLFEHYCPFLRRLAHGRVCRLNEAVKAREQADDLLQKVAARLLRFIGTAGRGGARFLAWLKAAENVDVAGEASPGPVRK
jgi:DNA-directed RNA polymerase specialized sigma24 family protein